MSCNWVNVRSGYGHRCDYGKGKWTFPSVLGTRMLPNSGRTDVCQIIPTPTVGEIMQIHTLMTLVYSFIWVLADQIEMKTSFTKQHLKASKLNAWWTHSALEVLKSLTNFYISAFRMGKWAKTKVNHQYGLNVLQSSFLVLLPTPLDSSTRRKPVLPGSVCPLPVPHSRGQASNRCYFPASSPFLDLAP